MKLYYSPGACSLSPHIALREAGLPVELVRVNLKNHQTQDGTDFYTINPKGYVPTLILDDGATLTEGPAIVQYIADQQTHSPLAPPNGSMARYRLQEWLTFIGTEIHKAFGPLWNPSAPGETRAAAQARLEQWFGWLDQHLGQHNYLMGDTFTVADGYLFTCVNWCNFLKISLAPWPHLGDYMQRVAQRPAVQAALRAEGLLD